MRAVVARPALAGEHADDDVESAERMAACDLARTRRAIRRHTDRVRATHGAALP